MKEENQNLRAINMAVAPATVSYFLENFNKKECSPVKFYKMLEN